MKTIYYCIVTRIAGITKHLRVIFNLVEVTTNISFSPFLEKLLREEKMNLQVPYTCNFRSIELLDERFGQS